MQVDTNWYWNQQPNHHVITVPTRTILHPKLGMGKCAIHRIPCACVPCTSMLEKPWISGIPSEKQERYQPVTKCTYWTVLGAFNNWNIIELSSKSTSTETFDEIHQVVLDGISDIME